MHPSPPLPQGLDEESRVTPRPVSVVSVARTRAPFLPAQLIVEGPRGSQAGRIQRQQLLSQFFPRIRLNKRHQTTPKSDAARRGSHEKLRDLCTVGMRLLGDCVQLHGAKNVEVRLVTGGAFGRTRWRGRPRGRRR